MRAGLRPLLVALAVVAVLLSACTNGGGGDGLGGGSDQDPEAAPSGPTAAQYDEAATLYRDLAGVLDRTNRASTDYQERVRTAWENDPAGFRKKPKVVRAVQRQRAVAARRDGALAALAEHPAMADEELGTAYRAFVDGYAAVAAYQDGFNDSYPTFLAAGDACQRLVAVQPPVGASYSETGSAWLGAHEEAAGPCLRLSAKLGESSNTDVARLSKRYRRLVTARNGAIEGFRDGRTDMAATLDELGRVDKAFTRDYARLTRFDRRIAALVPADLFSAVAPILADRTGTTPSPS